MSLDSGHRGDTAPCTIPRYEGKRTLQPFTSLDARVLDQDGRPIAALSAQACGVNLCLFSETDALGGVSITGEHELDRPAFKYGLGLSYAKFALPLVAGPAHALGDQLTVALPPLTTGDALRRGARVTSGGVTLELAADAEVDVDRLTYDDDEQGFRAALVPPTRLPEAVDPALGIELVFALAPVATELCPAASVTLDNVLGWPSGASVTLFVHGVEVSGKFAPYGGWAEVSAAEVSADGATIQSVPGQGLPFLSALGARLEP